jgi:hypothetical protein
MSETKIVLAEAAVVAAAGVSAPLAEVESWRSVHWASAASASSLSKVLRHADEQTIAAFRALTTALHDLQPPPTLTDWAVIGCPKFLGRMIICGAIVRYFRDPKFSISPHIIPNYTLHAQSGSISIGLSMYGANFGVGGGPWHLPEGLLTALSVISERRHPGLWLVLSEFDPEPRPDEAGKPTNDVVVHAMALALQPVDSGTNGHRGILRLYSSEDESDVRPTVPGLAAWWQQSGEEPWLCRYPGLGMLHLEKCVTA